MDNSPPLVGDGQIRAGTSGRAVLKQVYRCFFPANILPKRRICNSFKERHLRHGSEALEFDLTVGIARFAKFFHLSEKNLNPRENPQSQGFAECPVEKYQGLDGIPCELQR
jgi:hypothetical protein